ncbi:unnamed protein product [Ixodes hexagonus]
MRRLSSSGGGAAVLLITLFKVLLRLAANPADGATNSIDSESAIPAGKRHQYLLQDHAGKGSYKFGYDTGEGPHQNFRQEERSSDGTVRGRYGYMDANGYLRVVEYVADDSGFHVVHTKTELPQSQYRPKTVTKPHAPFLGPLPPFIPRPGPEDT